MACGNFSAATSFLKIATLFVVIIFILHIAGFAVPRWSTLKLSAEFYGIGVDTSYHAGLWKDCSCTSVLGTETCLCFSKFYTPDWLRAVQAVEAIGLIGLKISVILSVVILLSRQDKTVRGINIVMIACSGLFIVIGVIIFGVENTEDFDELFSFIESLPYDLDTHGSLSAAFALSATAGALCLLVCVPLLIKDYVTPTQPSALQVNPMPVQYTNQGHVIMPPPGQTHVVVNTSVQQPMGYMQPTTQGPAVYAAPGQPVQPSPAYPYQPQYGVQYSHQGGGLPYKA